MIIPWGKGVKNKFACVNMRCEHVGTYFRMHKMLSIIKTLIHVIAESQEIHGLKIWAIKLRVLLISDNMLKNIATANGECTEKNENCRNVIK